MKILLVNPKFNKSYRATSLPLGLLSLASYLKKNNHQAMVFDRTVEKDSIDKVIRKFSPDLIGLSLYGLDTYKDALHVSKTAQKFFIPVIWGGVLVSGLPDLALAYDCVDYVCLGEGEQTMLEMAQNFDSGQSFNDIAGLAYKDQGKVKFTGQREFLDLSKLPPLDFSLVKPNEYFISHLDCEKMLYLYTSKGCHFSCTFCYNNKFHQSTFRKRPLSHLEEEINYLIKNHGMDGIYFSDELFCGNKKDLEELCALLVPFNLSWGAQTAINLFDEEDFELMYASGCRWLCFGIESGSGRMQKKMKKNVDLERAKKLVAACERAGIAAITNFIIGLPGESEEDLLKTLSFALSLKSSLFNFILYAVDPCSEDYQRLVREKRQEPYRSFKALSASRPVEKVVRGINELNPKDLYVIRACFMLHTFFADKNTGQSGKAPFMVKVIKDAWASLMGAGFLNFITSLFYFAKVFLSAIFYSLCFPKTRRKYGLTKENGFSIF